MLLLLLLLLPCCVTLGSRATFLQRGAPPTSKDLRDAQRKGCECVSSAVFLRALRKCFVFEEAVVT